MELYIYMTKRYHKTYRTCSTISSSIGRYFSSSLWYCSNQSIRVRQIRAIRPSRIQSIQQYNHWLYLQTLRRTPVRTMRDVSMIIKIVTSNNNQPKQTILCNLRYHRKKRTRYHRANWFEIGGFGTCTAWTSAQYSTGTSLLLLTKSLLPSTSTMTNFWRSSGQ